MPLGSHRALPEMPERDQRPLEKKVLVLQSCIAGLFVIGAVSGWFGSNHDAARAGAAWIGAYHVIHGIYVVRWRIRGRTIRLVELLTPMMDVSCITTAWVVLGDAQSPFWAVYLYTLVGYGRRYVGARYAVLAGYIVVNILLARAIIAGGPLNAGIFDSNLLTMMVLALAVASLSHAIGSAWRNAEHRARLLAETDSLTGIANRRVFLEQLDALAAEPAAGFALLMLDLDDFKRLNDEHGHLYGDRVLAQVARILDAGVAEQGQVARYGGEEFVVMMPGASLAAAAAVAEHLRHDVMAQAPTTISVGCALRRPGEPAESALRRADELLLDAKRTGKNSVRTEGLRLTA